MGFRGFRVTVTKFRRITRHSFAIHQKLPALEIIDVWTYKKVGRVIRLKSESNTCILNKYNIFDSGLSNSTSIHQFYYSALTWLRSPTFSIRLDDESQVGTPLRQYLTVANINNLLLIWLPIDSDLKIWFGSMSNNSTKIE